MKIPEKTAAITGGSSGIGLAAARAFAAAGYQVYELSRHAAENSPAVHITADVTAPETLEAAFGRILREREKIDVLVCCAGMGVSGPVEFVPDEDMRRQFEVNLFGTVRTVRAALPAMRKAGGGTVLLISSVAAVYAIPFQAYYSASKAAVNAFADALRTEVAPFGVRVCAVMPGDIATGFTDARRKTETGSDVYRTARAAVEKMEKDERGGMRPETVAALLVKLAGKRRLAPLYTVGISYKTLVLLKRLFPAALASRIVGGMYK